MPKFKRELSNREIIACERAVGDTCRCRCGGTKHGAMRGGAVGFTDASNGTAIVDAILKDPEALRFFESLPADDPHRIRPEAEVKAARKLTARAATLAKRILRDMGRDHYWRYRDAEKRCLFVLGAEVAPEEAYAGGERRSELYGDRTVHFYRCAACGAIERFYLYDSAEIITALKARLSADSSGAVALKQSSPEAEVMEYAV